MDPANVLELCEVAETVHSLHHRNKNQHRRSIWFRWLSLLKRCVRKLISELKVSCLEPAATRLLYMANILLPNCYV